MYYKDKSVCLFQIVDEESQDLDGLEKSNIEVDLLSKLTDMTLQETDDVKGEADENIKNIFTLENPVFDPETLSSKILRIIEELVLIKEKGRTNNKGEADPENGFREKAVIVSQWTSMLHIVQQHLTASGMKTLVIDGKVPVKDRGPIVENFNSNPKGPKVLLLSLGAGKDSRGRDIRNLLHVEL